MSTPNCIVSSSDIVQTDGSSNAAATPLVHFSESGATALRTLKTSEAAAVLNVSPNTLRAWERRFGYPKPQRSPGKHRLYTHGEVAALRDALQEGLSISSAVSRAREALSADTSVLVGALSSYELDRADGAMEAALALRSLERSVEEVLLPSLHEIGEKHGCDSAPWAFAAQWANDWLVRAQRLAPPPCSSATPRATSSTATRSRCAPCSSSRSAPALASWSCPSPASPAWPTSSASSARSSW